MILIQHYEQWLTCKSLKVYGKKSMVWVNMANSGFIRRPYHSSKKMYILLMQSNTAYFLFLPQGRKPVKYILKSVRPTVKNLYQWSTLSAPPPKKKWNLDAKIQTNLYKNLYKIHTYRHHKPHKAPFANPADDFIWKIIKNTISYK